MESINQNISISEALWLARKERKYKGALMPPSCSIEDYVKEKPGRKLVDNDWDLFLPVDIHESGTIDE